MRTIWTLQTADGPRTPAVSLFDHRAGGTASKQHNKTGAKQQSGRREMTRLKWCVIYCARVVVF